MQTQSNAIKLSICIATFNRADFIGTTLESILRQITNECEIIVLDGGSSDGTDRVVLEYAQRCEQLRYIRQETNSGLDRDYDRAVELACGEYCWLMTDDDLLKPGAVASVLRAIYMEETSLVIVNVELRDFTLSRVVQPRTINFLIDRVYEPEELDRLFMELGDALVYIGNIIISRAIWITREKEKYFGSLFVFLGVIFQNRLPGKARVISESLISYRMSNVHTFSPKMFETLMITWPTLVYSLNVSDLAKGEVCSTEPWREFRELMLWRGWGFYSFVEYRNLIRSRTRSVRKKLIPVLVAVIPGTLANFLSVLYYSKTKKPYRGVWTPGTLLEGLKQSRFYFRNWRIFKRNSVGRQQIELID